MIFHLNQDDLSLFSQRIKKEEMADLSNTYIIYCDNCTYYG